MATLSEYEKMSTLNYVVRVCKKTLIADGIIHLELRSADGEPLPDFSPGSHIDLSLPNGLIRQYSLFRTSGGDSYEIAVLRDPAGRGGSRCVHEVIQENDLVEIGAPRNHFALNPAARYSILLAGGIGITPILAMAQDLAKRGENFELHYCARSADKMAFRTFIAGLNFAGRVNLYFDENGDRLQVQPILRRAPEGTHLYVCGPAGFIDHVTDTAVSTDWAADALHFERFGKVLCEDKANRPFKVRLARSGVTVEVLPDQTVAGALANAGVAVPLSCEQGVCGTCAMRVLEGIPDHRDVFFSDEEKKRNEYFTPCCSRSKTSELVLDF